jgi:hypothetical protein
MQFISEKGAYRRGVLSRLDSNNRLAVESKTENDLGFLEEPKN